MHQSPDTSTQARRNWPLVAFNAVLLGGLAILAMLAGLAPAQHKFHLYQAPLPLLVGAAVLLLGLVWAVEQLSKIQIGKKMYLILVVLGFSLSFVSLLAVAYALESTGYTWDSGLILDQAIKYGQGGQIDPSFVPYTINNPNNIALLAGLGMYFRAVSRIGVHDLVDAALILNIVVLTLTQLVTFATVKLLYGRIAALVSLVYGLVFLSLTMYVQISYTDTLTVIFPVTLLYLALRFARARRVGVRFMLAGLMGMLSLIGFALKPTVIIAMIAIFLVAIIAAFAKRSTKFRTRFATYAGSLLAFTAVALLTAFSAERAIDSRHILPYSLSQSYENSMPLEHYFAMGLITSQTNNTTAYGGYDPAQATYISSLPSASEKKAYAIELAKQRLVGYGPFGYPVFLAHKADWIYSDATFYAYGEGSNDKVTFTHQDRFSQGIREYMFAYGDSYQRFANFLQIFWLSLLLLIGAQVVIILMHKPSATDLSALLPRLMIVGITLFLLLFEGRSRYLFLYIPVFIVAAMYTLSWFGSNTRERPIMGV